MHWIKEVLKRFLNAQQQRVLRKPYDLGLLAARDVRVGVLGQLFPMKPTALSLMANDICNSRCQMCLIWKQKRDKEISTEELRQMLSDSFFQNLEYVGVTGGEPTLRKDLPDMFEVICSTLPRLRGPSLITNAIQLNQVIPRVLETAEVCRRHGLELSVMVSLDGCGDVHDTVRGRKGNFVSAIEALEVFRENGLRPSFGCTITSSNAAYVDDLLDYAKEHHLYGRFRMAEYIDRLYNTDILGVIRSFDDTLSYHLGLLFFRLEHDFENNPMYQKTYRNIRGMVAEGKRREIACPYQTHSVIVSARGELLYCSPKSPNLGSVLTESPTQLYFSNLYKRRAMMKQDCDNCIHDYHVPVTFLEKANFWRECRRRSKKYNCSRLISQASKLPTPRATKNPAALRSDRIIIVGWYGTETIGDKAILWSVVDRLRRRPHAPREIWLASMYPFISHRTLLELNIAGVKVVETYTAEFEHLCREADEVVVGGGPLMDLEALNQLLYAFLEVRRSGGVARIEGCGIGPLVEPRYISVVGKLLQLASLVTLRDRASVDRAINEFGILDATLVADPAVEYVHAQQSVQTAAPPSGKISCYLREWGREYAGAMDDAAYRVKKATVTDQLVSLVGYVATACASQIELLPMHCFNIGGDDRVYNRSLARKLTAAEAVRLPMTPAEIVQSMRGAVFNVCMRFHSVVFADTLGVPYVAIDYTSGGKIYSFLKDRNKLDHLISFDDLLTESWKMKVDALLRLRLVKK